MPQGTMSKKWRVQKVIPMRPILERLKNLCFHAMTYGCIQYYNLYTTSIDVESATFRASHFPGRRSTRTLTLSIFIAVFPEIFTLIRTLYTHNTQILLHYFALVNNGMSVIVNEALRVARRKNARRRRRRELKPALWPGEIQYCYAKPSKYHAFDSS